MLIKVFDKWLNPLNISHIKECTECKVVSYVRKGDKSKGEPDNVPDKKCEQIPIGTSITLLDCYVEILGKTPDEVATEVNKQIKGE